MTNLEISANVMTAVCIFLAGRNNIHTWWTGIVATILFGLLFFEAKLYADVTLQVFFVATGIIGWMGWKRIHPEITSASAKTIVYSVGLAILVALSYGFLLKTYTDAYTPMVDSLVLTFSVMGQLLLMRRQIQTWPIWLIVNTLAVPLFISRELYLTAGMYSIFWIHALYSWYSWNVKLQDRIKLQAA